GNEECMGTDAEAIVRELERLNVHPAFVLDEGGAVVEGVFPGVKRPAAVIGIAEKGSAFIDLTVLGKGGHASAPPAQQCVGTLARALSRLEKHAFPFHITAPAQKLFNVMGRHAPFGLRLVFANLWCFAPLLNLLCKKSGGELNALVRTTCAFTKLRASDAYNVLPSQCKAGVNLRILCEESMESVQKRMSRIIADDTVKISLVHGSEPSPISLTSGEPWERLSAAIHQTYPEALVAPYLMLAGSDSRHYARICEHVYRFSGMPLTKAQRGMIHNADERIPLALIGDAVAFFGLVLQAS
ncbi:MAG: M20/M25/M40 family metallo-hydrolase, partial [Clostridia bacterium]